MRHCTNSRDDSRTLSVLPMERCRRGAPLVIGVVMRGPPDRWSGTSETPIGKGATNMTVTDCVHARVRWLHEVPRPRPLARLPEVSLVLEPQGRPPVRPRRGPRSDPRGDLVLDHRRRRPQGRPLRLVLDRDHHLDDRRPDGHDLRRDRRHGARGGPARQGGQRPRLALRCDDPRRRDADRVRIACASER